MSKSYEEHAKEVKLCIFPWDMFKLVEKVNVLGDLLDRSSVMYPQFQGLDFRHDVPRLAVSVYVLDGQGELRGRRVLAHEWYAKPEAPRNRMYSFQDADHSAATEAFQTFHRS